MCIRDKFTAVRLDEADSTSSVIWPEIDEETFYQEMSVALSVSITAGPEHYEIKEPWEEQAHPVDCLLYTSRCV